MINNLSNKDSIQSIEFKYHLLYVIIINIMLYTFENLLNIPIFLNDTWFLKLIGTIWGFYLKDIVLYDFTSQYHIYIQNMLKYVYIFLFQNILFKIGIINFKVFDILNIVNVISYIFIYSMLDIILDVTINDYDVNKEMYTDIVKIIVGFILVESLIKNNLSIDEYIYIYFIFIVYLLFYGNIYSKIKLFLKNKFSN